MTKKLSLRDIDRVCILAGEILGSWRWEEAEEERKNIQRIRSQMRARLENFTPTDLPITKAKSRWLKKRPKSKSQATTSSRPRSPGGSPSRTTSKRPSRTR